MVVGHFGVLSIIAAIALGLQLHCTLLSSIVVVHAMHSVEIFHS